MTATDTALLALLRELVTDPGLTPTSCPLEDCYAVKVGDSSPLGRALQPWRWQGCPGDGTAALRVLNALHILPERYGIVPDSEAPLDQLVWHGRTAAGGVS